MVQNVDLKNFTTTQGFAVYGANTNDYGGSDYSGRAVASAGDVNGDGYDDIIIGAFGADPNGKSSAGTSYVIFGMKLGFVDIDLASLSLTQGFKILGAASGDYSGASVASAGDINGDGFDDIIIGAYGADPNGKSSAGISYVIFGKQSGFVDIDLASLSLAQGFAIYGAEANDFNGRSVNGAGDVNGDGFDDLIIGADGVDTSGSPYLTYQGASYVMFGKAIGFTNIDLANLSAEQGFAIYGSASGDYSGRSVSGAGDINRDGFDDIIIGSPGAGPNGKSGAGISYIIFGKATGFTSIDLVNLSTEQGFAIYGAVGNDSSGCSVSRAGDTNGDGFDDIIIGAKYSDPNDKTDAGVSYVMFGKNSGFSNIDLADLSTEQGFVIYGANAYDYSGTSVSGAGDINGDGFDDIVIGSEGAHPNGKSDAGISYIIFGKELGFSNIDLADFSTEQGFAVYGANIYDYSGVSVSGAGDVNGNGFDDIIIGAYKADPNGKFDAGTSYVLVDILATMAPTIIPTTKPSLLPTHTPTMPPRNIEDVYLYSLTTAQGLAIFGATAYDYSGFSVSGAGDVNGDGFDDVIIGAYYSETANGKPYAGTSYVVFGQITGFSNIDLLSLTYAQGFAIYGATAGDYSGFSVSGADDMNGDGYDDVIIGAYYANPSGKIGAGISYVIFGKATGFSNIDLADLSTEQGFAVFGASSYDYSGISVSGAGDINGDGYAEIIIRSSASPNGKKNAGASYIIFGKASNFSNIDLSNLPTEQGFAIYGASAYDYDSNYIGNSVSRAGDINRDGYNDIIIGYNGADPNGKIYAGTSYIIFGKATGFTNIDLASLSAEQGFAIYGANAYDYSGTSVSGAGDVNRDGFDDIIVGAGGADQNGKTDTGAIYIIFGKATNFSNLDLASLSTEQGFIVYGANSGDMINQVSGAGDVNGDGFDDIIIGSSNADPDGKADSGTSYVIFGEASGFSKLDLASLTIIQGFAIYGAATTYYSGCSVSGAGDINGDGYDDVIIGSYGADPKGKTNAGVSYVIFDSSGTFSPTTSPTISFMPTLEPTASPSIEPTSPTYNPTLIPTPPPKVSILDNINTLMDSRIFQVTFPVFSFLSSLAAGWFLRNKIVFHVLNNWGYSYKLIYNHDLEFIEDKGLKKDELGLYIKSDKLFCFTKDKNIAVEVNNGNNAGISPRLYEIIVQELTKHSPDPFILMQSEKNQIRDFLFSHNFINANDLGCIRGSVYKICLNSYKVIHKEKYAQQIRIDQSSINQSPLHEQIDNIEAGSDHAGDVELRETFSNIPEPSNSNNNCENNAYALHNKQSNTLLSVDAMMDPGHVKLQNEELSRFANHLTCFITEDLLKDVEWLMASTQSKLEELLIKNVPEETQAVAIHQVSAHASDTIFMSYNNFILSLLSAKQVIYHLPLIHRLAQNTINFLGYNVTLPIPLEHKALLISVDLVLGNLAAQYLPAEGIINGIFISTASTGSYAVRLMASDYLKNQELSDDSIELAQRCAFTIAAYGLPVVVNYALTKAILPETDISISTLDMLSVSSFGVAQCYNNYKAVYASEAEATTANIVVPYIADAITLWNLEGFLNLDTSTANLMIGIKNVVSVAATTYAVHCISSMVVDLSPLEGKEWYFDPTFNFASNAINDVANTCYQSVTDVSAYIVEEATLVIDYLGLMNLREDS